MKSFILIFMFAYNVKAQISVNVNGEVYQCTKDGSSAGTARYCKCSGHAIGAQYDGWLAAFSVDLKTGQETHIKDIGDFGSIDACMVELKNHPLCK